MDIDRFQTSPVGKLVPIHGHDAYLQRGYSHYAFVPQPAPTALTLSQGTYNATTRCSPTTPPPGCTASPTACP